MDRAELSLIELILNHNGNVNGFALLARQELFTPSCVVHNVFTNDLVGRNVNHVVFDGQVGARGINREFLFMIHEDDLWRKFVIELFGS